MWLKRFYCLVLLLGFVSCNQRKEHTRFLIKLSVISFKDETLKLYYFFNEAKGYSENQSKSIVIAGSTKEQTVLFELERIPYRFRIDLGDNANTEDIFVQSIILENGGKSVKINKAEVHRYFKANIYMRIEKGRVIRKSIDSKYDPFMESEPLLHKKLELVF